MPARTNAEDQGVLNATNLSMSVKHLLKCAGVGILAALIALAIGVAAEVAWLGFALISQGDAGSSAVRVDFAVHWFSFALGILAIVGLVAGFWWALRRDLRASRTIR